MHQLIGVLFIALTLAEVLGFESSTWLTIMAVLMEMIPTMALAPSQFMPDRYAIL